MSRPDKSPPTNDFEMWSNRLAERIARERLRGLASRKLAGRNKPIKQV